MTSIIGTRLVYILTLLVLMFSPIWGQVVNEEDLEKQAVRAFNEKDYEAALTAYDQLLEKYPRDPRFNYFSGVCLVQIGRRYNTALYQLKLASLGNAPADVYYFIGRAYYHTGQNAEAMDYYERFEDLSTRDTQRALELEKWKAFAETNAPPGSSVSGATGSAPFEASDYDQHITSALELQEKADSARTAADVLRKQIDAESAGHGDAEKAVIELEQAAAEYQLAANEKYVKAREMEKNGQARPVLSASGYANDLTAPGANIPGRGTRPYYEQVPDAFYKQEAISRILRVPDVTRLYELDEMNSTGNDLMRDAYELEKDRDQQKVVASAAASQAENKRAISKINRLETKIADKKLEAFQEFQMINDGKYDVYDGTLERILVQSEIEHYDLIRQYAEDARESHQKALERRSVALQTYDQEKKFDTYAEANAYELLAIHNQKMALGTYAGIIPVRSAFIPPAGKPMSAPGTNTSPSTPEPSRPASIATGSPGQPRPLQEGESRVSVENETASDIPPSLQSAVPGKTKPPGPVSENPVDPDQKRPDGATYEFAVLPTPDYNEIMPIPMDETLPDGIIYKVQVAAYKSTKPQSFFRGLEPISAEHIGYAIRYFAGRFSFYEDARNALKTVKKQGFRDAFIVAYINGVKSTVDRARTLEPEFAARFRDPDAHASLKSEPAHPSSRVHFRIQLGAFSHEISNDHLNSFKEHAGSNIVSYIKNNEGLYIYTIGNFSTFEDASAFNDTLRMQGLTEAFVIGIKEGQKIPAAEAREMLEFE